MNSEKVKEIKELLRCMNGEKACTNCYINEVAQEQETCCINVVADMTLELINELEKEIEENAFYSKGYAQGIKNTYEVVVPDKLKQFAERLKEKATWSFIMCGDHKAGAKTVTLHDIDETLKEFIGE